MRMYRQGDVLLVEVSQLPIGALELKPVGDVVYE